jgi:predicted nucleic acid-binding protein
VFVDTSALYAFLDRDDRFHDRARATMSELAEGASPLVTSNYVLVETTALVHARLGVEAVRAFQAVVAVLEVHWIGERLHREGLTALLASDQRRLSLVDCISFQLMREVGLDVAFAFDSRFEQQSFHRLG